MGLTDLWGSRQQLSLNLFERLGSAEPPEMPGSGVLNPRATKNPQILAILALLAMDLPAVTMCSA